MSDHAAPTAAYDRNVFHLEEEEHHEGSTNLGFWLYLMSDCLIFAVLFATYGVLGRSYAAGPSGADLFDLKLVALNTAMLLFSSITYGFAMLAMTGHDAGATPARRVVVKFWLEDAAQRAERTITRAFGENGRVQFWLAVTGLFGAAFLAIELYEFAHLIHEGATPQRSAFLSAFFALVGTHGAHVTFGLIWLVVLMIQIKQRGLIPENRRRLLCLSMFWHFLDVVWIGVFTFVYLMGVLP